MYEYDISENLSVKMNEYKNKFKENVPLMEVQGLNEEELIKVIDKCFKINKKVSNEDLGISENLDLENIIF